MSFSNYPEPAVPKLISSLDTSLVNRKVRIAGFSIGFEQDHQILLVYDGENHGCLIDTSLVLDSLVTIPSLRVDKTLITIIGYLERTEDPYIPIIPPFVDYPTVDLGFVIRAILLAPSPDLDLKLWKDGIQRRETEGIIPM